VEAELPDLGAGEALSWDYELLGLSPDEHPLRLLRARLYARGVLTAVELDGRPPGEVVRVAGLAIVRQSPPTAKGHLFISLEDETGMVNLIVRPDLYAIERRVLRESSVLAAEGTLQRDGRAVSVLVRKVWALGDGGWQGA
jgi:error-prone DNA polymerase